MSETPSLIMIQFLAWVAERPRTRELAVEAWHSCPHISVWEDAVVGGLVRTVNDGHRTIALTRRGRAVLEQSAMSSAEINAASAFTSAPRRPAAAALRRR